MPIPKFLADLRRKIGNDLVLLPTVVTIARDNQGRLLLVHDTDSGEWTLPGGIVEPGESPANAAVREVREEAGISVTLTHLIGVIGGQDCETTYRNGDRIAWVATIFGARLDDSRPVPDGQEVGEARLFNDKEVASLKVRADTARFLRAECGIGEPAHFE